VVGLIRQDLTELEVQRLRITHVMSLVDYDEIELNPGLKQHFLELVSPQSLE
jgi:hypothetical protein